MGFDINELLRTPWKTEAPDLVLVAQDCEPIAVRLHQTIIGVRPRMAGATDKTTSVAGTYASAEDFERIFTEDMSSLYLLSFVLTGSRDKAEECFVSAIGECTEQKRIFKEWAHSWARRSLTRNAIRLIAPGRRSSTAVRETNSRAALGYLPRAVQAEVHAILQLEPLERFAFVMSALERYSDHDCSLLLGCVPRDVIEARTRALQDLGLLRFRWNDVDVGVRSFGIRESDLPIVELMIARYFPASGRGRALTP